MRPQEPGFEALELAFLLQLRVVLDRLVEDLDGLLLATSHDFAPAQEQCIVRHWILPSSFRLNVHPAPGKVQPAFSSAFPRSLGPGPGSGRRPRARDEGEHPADDLERPAADRIAEDENAADDRGEVGRDRGEGDDLDPGADLQAAG